MSTITLAISEILENMCDSKNRKINFVCLKTKSGMHAFFFKKQSPTTIPFEGTEVNVPKASRKWREGKIL